MKVLLSDQGGEFCNKLIDELLNLIGTEHRVTSSYHPECNGRTERLNQTLIRSLRKHCEDDAQQWDKYLSFISFAYNTRINSVTKFTPYTGVFGILCNNFDDYLPESENNINKENNIKRIKTLIETTQKNIKSNRLEFQIKQNQVQNDSHRLAKEPYKIGDKVTIKVMKIQGKLQPRYNGIYTIENVTTHGNYTLKNENNQTLKNSFLHSRLKLIPPNNELDEVDEDVLEIEYIIAHRIKKKQIEYLVKYKDDEIPVWEPDHAFDTLEIIEQYWNDLNNNNEKDENKQTNETINFIHLYFRAAKIINRNMLILIIFMMCICSSIGNNNIIKSKFKLCDINNKQILDIHNSCKNENIISKQLNANYFILSKSNNEFDTISKICTIIKQSVSTYNSLLFNKLTTKHQQVIILSKEQCETIINTNTCDGKQMSCLGNKCESIYKPNIEYSWLQTNEYNWIECSVQIKRINAINAQSKIILNQEKISNCKANDFVCQTTTSTLVWSKNAVNVCPFKVIRQINLDLFKNILVSDVENKIFQITKEIKICNNISAYETAEGLYLTIDRKALNLESAKTDLKIIDGLLLSEMDFNKIKELQFAINIFSTINQKICQLYKSNLNQYLKHDDEFINFYDYNGNEAILYADNGKLFVPQCKIIEQIELLNTTECYKDIPIKALTNNITINAFITQEGIIKLVSKKTSCKNNKIMLNINNKTIIKQENKVSIINDQILDSLTINIQNNNITHINFMSHHDELLINPVVDLKESFTIIQEKDESHGEFFILEDHTSQTSTAVKTINNVIDSMTISIDNIIHKIILYITMILVLLIIMFICVASCLKN